MSDSGTFKVNPIHDAQQRALAAEAICQDILTGARNQLYLNMRFLDSALAALPFVGEMGIHPVGTDGNVLYYQPEELMELFKKGTEKVNRVYLHSLLHCLFGHLWSRKERDEQYWNLACDIAVEYVIDGLQLRAVHVPKTMLRREYYRKLKEAGGTVTAQ